MSSPTRRSRWLYVLVAVVAAAGIAVAIHEKPPLVNASCGVPMYEPERQAVHDARCWAAIDMADLQAELAVIAGIFLMVLPFTLMAFWRWSGAHAERRSPPFALP